MKFELAVGSDIGILKIIEYLFRLVAGCAFELFHSLKIQKIRAPTGWIRFD